jgi:hypothetical protein
VLAVGYGVSTSNEKAIRLPAVREPIVARTSTCSPGSNGASDTKLAPSPCEYALKRP